MGALGAAVAGVQVLDELRAGGAQRQCPGIGVAVGVAGLPLSMSEFSADPAPSDGLTRDRLPGGRVATPAMGR
jgi:hypothetical protein